jgi:purine nucleosidase/pyrimidine-specific ribonucleoside hydrolase
MVPPSELSISPTLEVTSTDQIPVIWDDDGSPDGVIALLYLLKNPQVQVEAITVSCGEAHPQLFAENLTRMLARIGRPGIPVAAGRDTPLEGHNAFPEAWRASTDIFWEAELPDVADPVESSQASLLIVNIVKNSPQPVTIFLTGNHTNLAEALKLDPSIKANIRLVEVMGGALNVPGNIASDYPDIPNWVAEWNIWVDPLAADEVFRSGIPIQLMPLDATNFVVWTEQDAAIWEGSDSPEGILASEILRWMLRSWFPEGVYAWDVVAAVDLTNPDLCIHTNQYVWVNTKGGDEQGQTLVDENKPPNMIVCVTPQETEIKNRLQEVFDLP